MQKPERRYKQDHNGIICLSNIMVPMRDGIGLATDIYMAQSAYVEKKALPVLLERTPYDKTGVSRAEYDARDLNSRTRVQVARWFAAEGYVCVMQDCRGRYRSEGRFEKYVNEAEDGADTLDWLMRQPWCNGRIGTMGLSYGAHTQTALACLNPEGLGAMFIDSGGFSSAYHSGIRQGGAFELKQATWAYRHALRSRAVQNDPDLKAALEKIDISAWFNRMPWSRGDSPLSLAPEYENYLFDMWEHGLYDETWRRPGLSALDHYDQFPDVPVAIIGSWYDPYVATCLTNYQALRERHQAPVRLVMGPWTHGDRSVTYAGDADFGSGSILDGNISVSYATLRRDWFDAALKDQMSDPFPAEVTYFRMGGGTGKPIKEGRLDHGGVWKTTDQWPPKSAIPLSLYLSPDMSLAPTPYRDVAACHGFDYDPHNPVPTKGGAITSGAPVMEGGGYDQGAAADRTDILSFETMPLEEDLEITGPVTATLWVSSNCKDTDFTIKLIDQYPVSADYPEGYALNITDGIFRLRYRAGWDREVLCIVDEIYEITIEAFATSNLFKKGHRIRLDISSSNFPHYDLNANTGESHNSIYTTARNRVHFGPEHPSHICLSQMSHK
ncbi:CocE/NonD family hydrolase [Paremcibacter congregatus]|uniref:CocE/NonD family hydrolase n=1 Tax=Paremcibacter congregatus TaxID=2043170 RepID=UPI003A93FF2A